MLGYNSRSPFFVLGFFLGYQLYSIAHFLPVVLMETKEFGLDILLVGSLVLLLSVQLEIGRRVANMAAATALRDSLLAAAACYVFFVLSPQPFWLALSFALWIIALSAIQVASGRLILLSPEIDVRFGRTNMMLLGAIFGGFTPKVIFAANENVELLMGVGVIVSALIVLRVHLYANVAGGYAMPGQLWFFRDIIYDSKAVSLLGISGCCGIILATAVFEAANAGAAAAGVAIFLFLSKRLILALHPERAACYSIYIAAGALLADSLLFDTLLVGSVALPFTVALIYSIVRIGAFCPQTIMSSAERMGLHNLGLVAGTLLAVVIFLADSDFNRRCWSIAIVLFLISYLISFVEPATPREDH